MNNLPDAHYQDSLLEDINNKYSIIIELVSVINKDMQSVKRRLSIVESQTRRLLIIEAAIKNQSIESTKQAARIATLENGCL